MESKITQEIDSYDSIYHFKIGILFTLILIFFFLLFKNIPSNDSISFVATFNYVEGINNNSEVQLAGIKIGDVNKIKIFPDGIIINAFNIIKGGNKRNCVIIRYIFKKKKKKY